MVALGAAVSSCNRCLLAVHSTRPSPCRCGRAQWCASFTTGGPIGRVPGYGFSTSSSRFCTRCVRSHCKLITIRGYTANRLASRPWGRRGSPQCGGHPGPSSPGRTSPPISSRHLACYLTFLPAGFLFLLGSLDGLAHVMAGCRVPVLRAGWPAGAGSARFRRAGQSGQHLADVTEPRRTRAGVRRSRMVVAPQVQSAIDA